MFACQHPHLFSSHSCFSRSQLDSKRHAHLLNVGASLTSALVDLIILACYPWLRVPTHFPTHSSPGDKSQKLLTPLAKQVKGFLPAQCRSVFSTTSSGKRVKLSACGHMSQSSYPKAKLLRLLCVLWTDLNRSQTHVCVSFNMNFFIIVYHGVYWPDRKEDVPCLYQFLWPWHTTVSLLVGVREITHLSFCWDLKWAVNKDSFTQQSLSSNHFSLEEFLFWWEDSQNTDYRALW